MDASPYSMWVIKIKNALGSPLHLLPRGRIARWDDQLASAC